MARPTNHVRDRFVEKVLAYCQDHDISVTRLSTTIFGNPSTLWSCVVGQKDPRALTMSITEKFMEAPPDRAAAARRKRAA